MAELVWTGAEVRRGGRPILAGVSLTLRPGELLALVGPNGAGKTTLLRAGVGLMALDGGTVRLAHFQQKRGRVLVPENALNQKFRPLSDGKPVPTFPESGLDGADPRRLPAGVRARAIAYLPQTRPLAWPLRVAAVVALGRFAHGGPLARPTGADAAAIARALAATRLEALAQRPTDTLSGGELARVHVARALAAEAPLLIADEPTAALDPLHALETMAIVQAFCARGGGALVTLHDLSLAARFADRVAVLRDGRLIAEGPPATALTPPILAEAFGVRAQLDAGQVRIEGPA